MFKFIKEILKERKIHQLRNSNILYQIEKDIFSFIGKNVNLEKRKQLEILLKNTNYIYRNNVMHFENQDTINYLEDLKEKNPNLEYTEIKNNYEVFISFSKKREILFPSLNGNDD